MAFFYIELQNTEGSILLVGSHVSSFRKIQEPNFFVCFVSTSGYINFRNFRPHGKRRYQSMNVTKIGFEKDNS